MRKLRRKPKVLEELIEKPIKKIRKIVYPQMRCQKIMDSGKNCIRKAIGKGMFCAKHGGTRLDNLDSMKESSSVSLFRGGLTEYNPGIHPMVYLDMARNGHSEEEIATHLNISTNILRKWADTHKEFAIAYEIGDTMHKAWWINQGKGNLDNRFYQTGLFKFLTGNLLGWSEKVEQKNINQNAYGVLVVPGKMSIEEWEMANVKESESIEASYKTIQQESKGGSNENP